MSGGSPSDRLGTAYRIAEQLEARDLVAAELERAIDQSCGDDPQLGAEVRAILGSAPSGFLGRPPIAVPWLEQGESAGRTIGERYQLEEVIGAGSMGIVYRGRHKTLDRPVAIKLIRSSLALAPGEEGRRMLKEARAAAGVRHRGVVEVHDVGLDEGTPYMVMDWIEGPDLGRWVAELEAGRRQRTGADLAGFLAAELGHDVDPGWSERPYSEVVARFGAELARAVQAAHDHGVVHRDLAPKNVLLKADGQPVLVDFGVAALTRPDEASSTRGGAAGTLPYMAPECLLDPATARLAAVDIYSLGATLYHLLAGRAPFEAGPEGSLIQRIVSELPPDLASLDPDLPRDLVAVVFAAMEKRPADRYTSALELAEDLEAFLERRPVSRRNPGSLGRLARWSQRRPGHALAAGLGVLALVSTSLFGAERWEQRLLMQVEERSEAFADGFAHLPAVLTLEPNAALPGAPLLVPAEEGAGPLLAELIELEPGEPLLAWYRAHWASQRGQLELCRTDLERLAAAGYDSPRFEALAAALVDPDPGVRNRLLAPDELPAALEGRAFDHAMLGHLALRWRAWDLAWDELSEALRLEPERWLYRDLRIMPGMQRGRGEVSIDDALRIEEVLGRPTPRSLHARALVAQESQRAGLARELWTELLVLVPGQHQALHGIGRSWYLEGDYAKAEELLERAIVAKPGSWTSYLLLARCAQEQERFAEALAVLERGRLTLPPATESGAYYQHFELGLESIDVLLAWASTAEAAGEDAEHLYLQTRAVVRQLAIPEGVDPTGIEQEFESLRVALDVKLGQVELRAALRRQRELLAKHLDVAGYLSPVITTNLGTLLLELGDEGRLEAQVWLGLDPRWNEPHSRAGLALVSARDLDGTAASAPSAPDPTSTSPKPR
ncbi:MAG: protein kinase [Planctomycetota bacterium]|nr:protein kinase [Planctomycetota bacterium]